MGQSEQMIKAIAPESFDLIDIGVNLTNSAFNNDLAEVLQRAQQHGVKQIIVTGVNAKQSLVAAELCKQHPNFLYSTAGCHPHDAKDFQPVDLDILTVLAAQKQVLAIGECGLDFNRNYSPQDIQIEVFKQQLELAAEVNLPVFLHQRDAHDTFLAILKDYHQRLKNVVVHCFTDGIAELQDYLELDCYIGVTGWICDQKRAQQLLQATPFIPDKRLLIETDAPYLLPKALRPKPKKSRNEPMNLLHVCEAVAKIRNQSAKEISDLTYRNSKTFFGI